MRARHCTGALTACCGRCSTLEQLCSALKLINPWTCSCNTSGCPAASYMQHNSSSNRSSSSSSSSSDAEHSSRSSSEQNHIQQIHSQCSDGQANNKGQKSIKAFELKVPDDQAPHHTALADLWQEKPSIKSPGRRSRAALNAALHAAAAATGATPATAAAASAAAAAQGVRPANRVTSSEAARQPRVAAPDAREPTAQQQQQQQPQQPDEPSQAAANSSVHSTALKRTSSSSSSSSSSGGCSLDVPGDAACFTSHPLPSYVLNDEEQDSYAKAKEVVAQLQAVGYKALIVGGWVRDKFLGRRASDIDISTNATPWQLKKLFRDVVELPRSTVKLNYQGEVLEVTCFRGISRSASMFSVAMDAARRDFTINALYYDPITDQVLDCVGGVEDAQQKVLRLTGNAVARLEEDPLRVLRCVRFVTVLGLRIAPATAHAVKQHAHLCSVKHGLPPRRIWLELCKLRRAEQQQAGRWAVAMKLCYHLGLLQHIFPWLQQDPKLQPGSSTPVQASVAQQQAVLVAERLGQLWQGRSIPLGLMVAATLHPAASATEHAWQQLESYFLGMSDDLAAIRTLHKGAQLMLGDSATSSCTQEDAWVQFYAGQHAAACLDILAAWIPDAVAGSFQQLQQARIQQLRDRISHHRQLLRLKREQQAVAQRQVPVPLPAAACSEALQQRRLRQKEELAAAIHALMVEREQQMKQERQQITS